MTGKKNNQGFILIELLISIAVFILVASAIASMILGGFNLLMKGEDYSYANNLAQENIEASKAIKSRGWNNLIFSKSALQYLDEWQLAGEGTEERILKYNRYLTFQPVYRDANRKIVSQADGDFDINSLLVNSVVYWQDNNKQLEVNQETIFTNWESSVWQQTDWSEGSGFELYNQENVFWQSADILPQQSLSLTEISTSSYSLSGELESAAFGPVESGAFNVIMWKESIPDDCSDCAIKIQIKTAEDNSGSPLNWENLWSGPDGPDGDEDDYFSSKEGQLINRLHNQRQWIKYKVVLEGDGIHTPSLDSISIYYQ